MSSIASSRKGGRVAAFPWYLLAFGIVLTIVGILIAALMSRGPDYIDPKMDDDEIAERLNRGAGIWPSVLIVVGVLCVLVSIIWRIVLWVLPRL
jgi:hypothetical protein